MAIETVDGWMGRQIENISVQLHEMRVLLEKLQRRGGSVRCVLCHSAATNLWNRDLSQAVPLCQKHFDAVLKAEKPIYG